MKLGRARNAVTRSVGGGGGLESFVFYFDRIQHGGLEQNSEQKIHFMSVKLTIVTEQVRNSHSSV